MRYAVIDASNIVVNVIMWDGISSWFPPDDCRAVPIPDGMPVDIGWQYDAETKTFELVSS